MTRRLNRISCWPYWPRSSRRPQRPQAKPIANWVNLNQLVAGSEIRVTLAAGKTMRGFVERVTAESLAIQRDHQPGDALPAGHPARRTEEAWASRAEHAHWIGGGNGRRPGRGCCRRFQVGPRSDVSDLGKVAFSSAGMLLGTVIGVACHWWMARRVSRAVSLTAG